MQDEVKDGMFYWEYASLPISEITKDFETI